MSKVISLTQGKQVIVDDEDFGWISQWNWYAHKQGNTFYAKRTTGKDRKVIIIHMHREIVQPPKGMYVDHIDGNGLNNQRSNLRICTKAQNGMNRGKQANNSSGYKGVGWDRTRNKWRAQIKIGQGSVFIGRFDRLEDAIKAYDAKALELFGEFAKTNF